MNLFKKISGEGSENIKNSFSSRKFKSGSYNAAITALVIAIVIIVNLAVGQLPAGWINYDISDNKLISLSEQSVEIASGVDEEVTIYFVAQNGSEDLSILTLLEKYAALSPNIKLVREDPVLHPTFLNKYEASNLADNSVIVESAKRFRAIDYSEIVVTEYDYSTWTSVTTFDGEGAITSAIDFVITDDIPKAYMTTGHEEKGLTTTLTSYIARENIETASLNLIAAGSVPSDADCLIIAAPQKDISAAEATAIMNYLDGGGKVLLITEENAAGFTNLMTVAESMGVTAQSGIVMESDSSNYVSYPFYLMPAIKEHEITKPLTDAGKVVLSPISHAITRVENPRSTLQITDLLLTSSSAYIKEDTSNIEKALGDPTGTFSVGVAVYEEYLTVPTYFVWLSAYNIINENIDAIVAGANTDLVLNSLGWMCEQPEGITIRAKDVGVEFLVLSQKQTSAWSWIFTGIIPAAIVAVGMVIWIRRRKR